MTNYRPKKEHSLGPGDHKIIPDHAQKKHESNHSVRVSKKKLFISITIIVVFALGLWYFTMPSKDYAPLAKCISDSGAKFYGAFWCPHCEEQKRMFGSAKNLLPYVECSTPDGQGQLDVCKGAGIVGYPTWIFADGTNMSGTLAFQTLADKTNCVVP